MQEFFNFKSDCQTNNLSLK